MSWILDLFGFGFGSGTGTGSASVKLILQPDASAKQLAGFKSGASLELTAIVGETVGSVMDKFNTYRGPDQQITKLWTVAGNPLPFSTVITEQMYAVVRA